MLINELAHSADIAVVPEKLDLTNICYNVDTRVFSIGGYTFFPSAGSQYIDYKPSLYGFTFDHFLTAGGVSFFEQAGD